MDPNAALRVELQAALDILLPQIRGLINFAEISTSPIATQEIINELVIRQRRRDRINQVIAAMDSEVRALADLYADGYPNFAPVIGAQDVFAQIQSEDSDFKAAADIFKSGGERITLDIAHPVHTHQTIPTS